MKVLYQMTNNTGISTIASDKMYSPDKIVSILSDTEFKQKTATEIITNTRKSDNS